MMKQSAFGIAALAMVWLTACGKKEQTKPADVPPVAEVSKNATPPADPAPTPKPAALTAEERAGLLGFAGHLPQDTGIVMSFYNGSKIAARVKTSKLWKLVRTETGIDLGGDDTADGEAEEPGGPAALFGREFTIALGESVGEQTAHLIKLNARINYFQMRTVTRTVAEALKSDGLENLTQLLDSRFDPQMLREMLADPESGVALFEQMAMPPLYLAFRTSAEGRAAAAQQLAALTENLGMFGNVVEPVEVEKAGGTFTGHKISGKAVAEEMKNERESLEEFMDPAVADRMIEAISMKDLVVLSGTVGEYVMLFFGASVDDLKLVEKPGDSLAASADLAFADGYVGKELAAVVHGRKDTLTRMHKAVTGLADSARGLRDGLAAAEELGDTRDIQKLLSMVGEREVSLQKLATTDAYGMVAYFEDGLKIEGYGGNDSGAVNWEAPNRLASLGGLGDVALFLNMTTRDAYNENLRAYLKVITEAAYAMATHAAALPDAGEQLEQLAEMVGVFDEKFRPHLVAIWEAIGWDFSAGLGGENALVLDLNGSVPAVPGLPQSVVDEAKFPRITLVSPVTDRARLAGSWEKLNTSITSLLKEFGEMTDQEIPMQKPVSTERDGFTTWFFSMPFFQDDFLPSVTVGEEWFAASTSKNHALDLLAKAGSGESALGTRLRVDFAALSAFASETLEILAKNPDAIPLEVGDIEQLRKLTGALVDLDNLSAHTRREDGVLRSSIHFKTR